MISINSTYVLLPAGIYNWVIKSAWNQEEIKILPFFANCLKVLHCELLINTDLDDKHLTQERGV